MSTIIITFVDLSIFIMEYIKHITLHQIDRFENITSTFSPENFLTLRVIDPYVSSIPIIAQNVEWNENFCIRRHFPFVFYIINNCTSAQ
jgi:hypothetical protein